MPQAVDTLQYMIRAGDRTIIEYERMPFTADLSSANAATYCFDTMRVVRIVSGSLQWKIGDRLYDLHENDIVLLSNTEYRRITKVISDGTMYIDVIAFHPEAVQFNEECLRAFLERTPRFSNAFPSTPAIDAAIASLIGEITREKPSAIMLSALLIRMCIELMREVERQMPDALGKPDAARVKNVLTITNTAAYIQNHLAENLTLEDLARQSNMSVSYFTRLFRQHLGVSVHDFLVRRRVERVTHLLQTTDMDVLEAAFQCGFQSSSGFYRAYRTVTGSAPISNSRKNSK